MIGLARAGQLLLILGIVTPAEGLSGFSNEATVAIAAMFALNAGVVGCGGLDPVIRMLIRIKQPWLLTFAIMLADGFARRLHRRTPRWSRPSCRSR